MRENIAGVNYEEYTCLYPAVRPLYLEYVVVVVVVVVLDYLAVLTAWSSAGPCASLTRSPMLSAKCLCADTHMFVVSLLFFFRFWFAVQSLLMFESPCFAAVKMPAASLAWVPLSK